MEASSLESGSALNSGALLAFLRSYSCKKSLTSVEGQTRAFCRGGASRLKASGVLSYRLLNDCIVVVGEVLKVCFSRFCD